jgi:predicted ribosomally synthesized peptide with SipW-like signal peptide
MKKGKVLATCGAVALIGAIGIGSTLAYLTDQTGTVTNTFTVGNVTFDDDFNGGLSESKVVREGTTFNEDGTVATVGTGAYQDADGDDWTSTGNDYTNLYPGETVLKDPTVKLAATSRDAWVYAQVTYNAAQFETIEPADGWELVEDKTVVDGDTVTVVFAKTEKLTAATPSTIFTEVQLKDDVLTDQDAELDDIVVKACAVQADGFESSSAAISEINFGTDNTDAE